MTPEYYDVLRCGPQSDHAQIQAEFRRAARQLHPDRSGGGDRAQWELVREAYEVLGSPQRRAQYDRWRAAALPVPFAQWAAAGAAHTVHWTNPASRAIAAPPQPADIYELFHSYSI